MTDHIEKRYSGLGVASFVVSLVVAVSMLLLFIVAGVQHNGHPSGPYPGQTFLGLMAITLLFTDFASIGLGIAAVCQKEANKLFGILGIAFSALTILGTVGLVVLGLMISGKL